MRTTSLLAAAAVAGLVCAAIYGQTHRAHPSVGGYAQTSSQWSSTEQGGALYVGGSEYLASRSYAPPRPLVSLALRMQSRLRGGIDYRESGGVSFRTYTFASTRRDTVDEAVSLSIDSTTPVIRLIVDQKEHPLPVGGVVVVDWTVAPPMVSTYPAGSLPADALSASEARVLGLFPSPASH